MSILQLKNLFNFHLNLVLLFHLIRISRLRWVPFNVYENIKFGISYFLVVLQSPNYVQQNYWEQTRVSRLTKLNSVQLHRLDCQPQSGANSHRSTASAIWKQWRILHGFRRLLFRFQAMLTNIFTKIAHRAPSEHFLLTYSFIHPFVQKAKEAIAHAFIERHDRIWSIIIMGPTEKGARGRRAEHNRFEHYVVGRSKWQFFGFV